MYMKSQFEKKKENIATSDEESFSSDDELDDEADETYFSSQETKSTKMHFKTKSAHKRAHHNALERKRRDLIKEKFENLKNEVPTIKYLKHSPRIQILAETSTYIEHQNQVKSELDEVLTKKETLKRQLLELQSKFGIETPLTSSKKRKGLKGFEHIRM